MESVPAEWRKFIGDKVEGNPFYLEEVINSLVESETLVHGDVGGLDQIAYWNRTCPRRYRASFWPDSIASTGR